MALEAWRAMDGQRTVTELTDVVRAQFDPAPESATEDVIAFLSGLARRGFVLAEAAPSSASPERFPSLGPGSRSAPAGRTVGGEVAVGVFDGFPLVLADGSRFLLRAGDEPASRVVARFAASASLTSIAGHGGTRARGDILVVSEGSPAPRYEVEGGSVCFIQAPEGERERRPGKGRGAALAARPFSETEWLWRQLARLSAFIGKEVQAQGGVLLHGALVLCPAPPENGTGGPGSGILLGGRSGVGKTTACDRLPRPWRALCDDTTLIVRNGRGEYRAHPWPTWSRVFGEHGEDRWDVQRAVPLRAIFVMNQAARDRAAPAGRGEAVGLLLQLARQASRRFWLRSTPDEFRAFHTRRFENLCALVQAIPSYLLDVSRDGTFWDELTRVQTS